MYPWIKVKDLICPRGTPLHKQLLRPRTRTLDAIHSTFFKPGSKRDLKLQPRDQEQGTLPLKLAPLLLIIMLCFAIWVSHW